MTLPKNRNQLFNLAQEVKDRTLLSYHPLIGANVNRRDETGGNALFWAIKNRSTHNAKLPIEFESSLMVTSKLHALFHAIEEDHYELAVLLVQGGICPNIEDEYGRSVLMSAILKEQFRTVCFLIRNGADLFQMDHHYDMALDYASRSECEEIKGFVEHVLATIETEEKERVQRSCSACINDNDCQVQYIFIFCSL